MKAAIALKQRLDQKQLTTGVLATNFLWLDLVETLIKAGLDYMIIDMEHGPHDERLVADVCTIGRLMDFPVLIRPRDNSYATVRAAIDRGPCGLLLAGVESTDCLDEVRRAIYMPPRGQRRPGGAGNRWVDDYNYPTWKAEVEDHFIVLPQIETKVGLSNVDAIASHDIVTAIAVGPYDLSAELGVCWDPTSPLHRDALQCIREAGERAGKTMWMIGDGAALAANGYHFLCIAEPMMMLEQALKQANQKAKAGSSSASDVDAVANASDADPLP